MRNRKALALGVFIAGVALFLGGVVTGDTKVYLAVIIPVIETTSLLSIIGILLMFGAFFMWFMGAFTSAPGGTPRNASSGEDSSTRHGALTEVPGSKGARRSTKAGGIILIGPIPIMFSNDRRLAIILMILGIALVAAAAVLILFIL